jgi:NAD(P)-dependent dehydrogenase (short-subunit alcohol dehydrogenase family)
MTKHSISGHVAIVTGGAHGIGRAVAELLASHGCSCMIFDFDHAAAASVSNEIQQNGGVAAAMFVDLGNIASLGPAVEETLELFGRIDILVNCGGISGNNAPLLELREEDWDRIVTVNLKSQVFLIKHVANHMKARGGGGKIVNLSSSSAFRARGTRLSYAVSKLGIVQLTRCAAAELGPYDINVNAVAPGLTITPMTMQGNTEETLRQRVTDEASPNFNLLGRPSLPLDIAETVVFLCMPGSRQITGQCVQVNAGAII